MQREAQTERPPRPRLKHRLEYAALRVAAGVLGRLPYRLALALMWGIAWFGHYVVRHRRAEARRRIRAVLGPEVSAARIRRIAWISWRNLCFNAVEMARFPRLSERWLRRHTDFHEMEQGRERQRAGLGAVVAVPHAGNWDLAGVVASRIGFPIFFIARRQKNPLADAWINRMRAATGARTVLNDAHLLRGVLGELRAGRFMAILPDVRVRRGGINVPFLNGIAHWGRGTAFFARQAGVPVFPVICRREGWSRHVLRVFGPIEPDASLDETADVERITRRIAETLSGAILEAPEQYFWYNKRWVLDPPDAPSARRSAEAPSEPSP